MIEHWCVVDMHHQMLSTHVSSTPHQQTSGQRHLQWHNSAISSISLCQKVCGTDILRIIYLQAESTHLAVLLPQRIRLKCTTRQGEGHYCHIQWTREVLITLP